MGPSSEKSLSSWGGCRVKLRPYRCPMCQVRASGTGSDGLRRTWIYEGPKLVSASFYQRGLLLVSCLQNLALKDNQLHNLQAVEGMFQPFNLGVPFVWQWQKHFLSQLKIKPWPGSQ